jgi:hypothetical protein
LRFRPSDVQNARREWRREGRQRSGGSGELSSQERARGCIPPLWI